MSWQLAIMKLDRAVGTLDELPADHVPLPLGSPDEVRAAISRTFTTTEWREPSAGVFEGDGFSLDFRLGGDPTVESLTVDVRRGGHPLAPLASLCASNGWQGLDVQTGIFLDLSKRDETSWQRFCEWRVRTDKR
jgi:hypothetical protein